MSSTIKTDRAYTPGDRLGTGGPLPQNQLLTSTKGSGTLEDPQVSWLSVTKNMSAAMISAHENLCRQIAKDQKQQICVIRGATHDTFYDKVRGVTTKADDHITVYLGKDMNDLRLQGHIFVKKDDKGLPARLANVTDLKYVPEGKDPRVLELYGKDGSNGYDYQRRDPNQARPVAPNGGGTQTQQWSRRRAPPKVEFRSASQASRNTKLSLNPVSKPKPKPVVSADGWTEVPERQKANRQFNPMPSVAEGAENQPPRQAQVKRQNQTDFVRRGR